MAHSKTWARTLLRDLPDDPEALLVPGRPAVSRTYADPTFLPLFFDWLDERIFHDPQEGLRWAKVAPRLVLMAPKSGRRQAYRDNLVKVYAILGGAYRATSQHDDAEKEYRTALRIVDSETISPAVQADLLQRFSSLRICQGEYEEALGLLDELLERYDKEPFHASRGGRALVRRGYALEKLQRFSEAVDCFGEVLRKVNPKESAAAERTHHAATHNLAATIQSLDQDSSKTAWEALAYVCRAKKIIKRPGLPLHSLQWVEGLIWRKLWTCDARTGLSLVNETENALQRARIGFLALRAPWEIALVGLDLAMFYRSLGRWEKLFKLALETLERFRILSGDTQTVAALGLLLEAARAKNGVKAAIGAAQNVIRTKVQQRAKGKTLTRTIPTGEPPSNAPLPPVGRSNVAMVKTRRELLEAAYEDIPNGFLLGRIMKRVGITKTTFYLHFKDREDFALAVVDEHMRGLIMDWLRRVDETNPIDALEGLVEDAPPLVAPPATGSHLSQEYRRLVNERIEAVYQLWRRGLALKLIRGQQEDSVRTDIDPDETAAYLIAGVRARDPWDPQVRGAILWHLETLRPTDLGDAAT